MNRIPYIGDGALAGVVTNAPNLSQAFYVINNSVAANTLQPSFSLPAGTYEFVLSGGGGALGGGTTSSPWMAGAGGLCISTRTIAATDTLTTTTAQTASGADVTLTLPDGTKMSAGGGSSGYAGSASKNYTDGYDGTGGAASGGDINMSANGRTPPSYNTLTSSGIPTRSSIGGGVASLLIFRVG